MTTLVGTEAYTDTDCISYITVIERWIKLRAQYLLPGEQPLTIESFGVNARKSCLLLRLLQGKEPLPLPPPTAYSAPWYELIETGHAEHATLEGVLTLGSLHGTAHYPKDAPTINICQFPWVVLETVEDRKEYIVHAPGRAEGRWRYKFDPSLIRDGLPDYAMPYEMQSAWRLDRIREPSDG